MPERYSVVEYVEEVRAIHRIGAGTPETAFYPPVSRLLNAIGEKLKQKVLFLSQLKDQGAGMPDGGFFSQPKRSPSNVAPQLPREPDYGAVEIKPARWSLDELTKSEQTALSPQVQSGADYGCALKTRSGGGMVLRMEHGSAFRLRPW